MGPSSKVTLPPVGGDLHSGQEGRAPTTHNSSPSYLSPSSQFVNSASLFLDQRVDTSYGHVATTPSFQPKSDFPQVGDSNPSCPLSPPEAQRLPIQGTPAAFQGSTKDFGWAIGHVETWLVLENRGVPCPLA